MEGQFDDAPDDVTEPSSFHREEKVKEAVEVSFCMVSKEFRFHQPVILIFSLA